MTSLPDGTCHAHLKNHVALANLVFTLMHDDAIPMLWLWGNLCGHLCELVRHQFSTAYYMSGIVLKHLRKKLNELDELHL